MKEKEGSKRLPERKRTVYFSLLKVFYYGFFLYLHKAGKNNQLSCTYHRTWPIRSLLFPFLSSYAPCQLPKGFWSRHLQIYHFIQILQYIFLTDKDIFRHNHTSIIMPNKVNNNFLFFLHPSPRYALPWEDWVNLICHHGVGLLWFERVSWQKNPKNSPLTNLFLLEILHLKETNSHFMSWENVLGNKCLV